MTRVRTIAWLASCLLSCGCGLVGNATRVLVCEPTAFNHWLEERRAEKRNAQLAEQHWHEVVCARMGEPTTDDYSHGFREGFVDFLRRGVPDYVPDLPPREYWKTAYQSPEGYQAIQEWYSGFKHGASVARDKGYRQWMAVPYGPATSAAATPVAAAGPLLPGPMVGAPDGPPYSTTPAVRPTLEVEPEAPRAPASIPMEMPNGPELPAPRKLDKIIEEPLSEVDAPKDVRAFLTIDGPIQTEPLLRPTRVEERRAILVWSASQ